MSGCSTRPLMCQAAASLMTLFSLSSFHCNAFSITPSAIPSFHPFKPNHITSRPSRHPLTKLFMAPKSKPPPLPDTTDPFLLLGLDPTAPPTNAADIKRAYRKRAMMYHPDVLTSSDSSEEERRVASENFAKINAAYEMLSGGGGSSSNVNEKKTSSGGYNYQPPHRRSSTYTTTKSTNWEDYMPNYPEEDERYDAGGDSFGAIFSDLFTGVAAGAAGGRGGIMNDFIEFLERNVDGFSSGYDDDTSLEQLLSSGSFEEVANEMDEMDVLVSSLEKKLSTVQEEVRQLQADLKYATKYSEKIDMEERMAELKAREKVVGGYLKKGRSRLLRLRERYKELIVQGKGGRGYDSATTGSSSSAKSYSAPPPTPSPNASYNNAPSPSSSSSSGAQSTESNSWRTEGFGGYGRRSSSSRRSSRRRSNATRDDTSKSSSEQPPNQQKREPEQTRTYTVSSDDRSSRTNNVGSRPSSPVLTGDWTPPHRRTQSSTQTVAEEKRRLRELKIDDEFEKLKREMGQM